MLSFGKIKAAVISFFIGIVITFSITASFSAVGALMASKPIIAAIKDDFYFFLLNAFIVAVASWSFYDDALLGLKKVAEMEEKGITPGSLRVLDFVKIWGEKRRVGVKKYTLFNSGLLTGALLLIPVSLLLMKKQPDSDRMFPEFSDMMLFIGEIILISYILGCVIGRIKWAHNERKYKSIAKFSVEFTSNISE